MKIFKIALFLALSSWCYGQNTLIRNVGFEDGSQSIPDCDYRSLSSFDGDVDWWNGWAVNTLDAPDWINVNHTPCITHLTNDPITVNTQPNGNYLGEYLAELNSYPWFWGAPHDYWGDRVVVCNEYKASKKWIDMAVRSAFITPLLPDVTYTVRVKYVPVKKGGNHLRVHFTTWSANWDANSNNNQQMLNVHQENHFMSKIGNIGFEESFWRIMQFDVTIPNDKDDLKNIILESTDGVFLIDDIEMWVKCDPNMTISNKQYDDHFFEHTGRFQNNPIITQSSNQITTDGTEVRVWADAKHTFKAVNEIVLKPGFHAEHGSQFSALLGPCNGTSDTWNWPKFNKSFGKSGYTFNNFENAVSQVENPENGDIYVLSTITQGGDKSILISRLDKFGNLIETKLIGETDAVEEAHGMVLSYDRSHLIIVGSTTRLRSDGLPDRNLLAIKHSLDLNTTNALIWAHHWGSDYMDESAYQIAYDLQSSNSYFVLGESDMSGERRINLTSIADGGTSGQVLWHKMYNDGTSGYNEVATSFVVKNGGNGLMIAGLRDYGSTNFIHTIETSRTGALTGKGYTAYTLSGNATQPHITQLSSHDYAISTSMDKGGVNHAVLIKLDADMVMSWANEYAISGMLSNDGIAVQEGSDGELMLGSYHVDNYGGHIVGTRLDETGVVISSFDYLTTSNAQGLQSVANAENGFIFKTRQPNLVGYSIIKVDHEGGSDCRTPVSLVANPLSVQTGNMEEVVGNPSTYQDAALSPSDYSFVLTDLDDCGSSAQGPQETFASQKPIAELKVRVYPNPATNGVHIQLSSGDASMLTISNASGQITEQYEILGVAHYLDMTDYAEGFYLIKVENHLGTSVHRVVKK